jgi:hypothetical protein
MVNTVMSQNPIHINKMMNILSARTALVGAAAAMVLAASAADSQTLRRANGEAFNLPQDICRFERYADSSLALIRRQPNFAAVLQFAAQHCPNVALQLSGVPVASIVPSTFGEHDRGDDPAPPPGGGGGGPGGGGPGGPPDDIPGGPPDGTPGGPPDGTPGGPPDDIPGGPPDDIPDYK